MLLCQYYDKISPMVGIALLLHPCLKNQMLTESLRVRVRGFMYCLLGDKHWITQLGWILGLKVDVERFHSLDC